MAPNSRMAKDDQRRHHRPLDEDAGEVHDFPAIELRRIDRLDLRAGKEPQLPVGDDRIARRDTLFDHHLFPERAAGGDDS